MSSSELTARSRRADAARRAAAAAVGRLVAARVGAVGAVPALAHLGDARRAGGGAHPDRRRRARPRRPRSGRGPAFLDQITANGLFVGFTALVVCVPLFLPLTVGVVAGDTIAGEASHGTLRYLVIAPAGRLRLLGGEVRGRAAFCIAATLVVDRRGLADRRAAVPDRPGDAALGRAGRSCRRRVPAAAADRRCTSSVSLLGLCAIGLFLSTLTDVPVGAMAATIVLSVVSQVLDQLPQLDGAPPVAVQPLLARVRRPPARADLVGLVRQQRAAAARLRRGVRGARGRPVHDEGHPLVAVRGLVRTDRRATGSSRRSPRGRNADARAASRW